MSCKNTIKRRKAFIGAAINAAANVIGGIKSINTINGINVTGDGTATVNKIAVAKLDLNGDTFILNGGNA